MMASSLMKFQILSGETSKLLISMVLAATLSLKMQEQLGQIQRLTEKSGEALRAWARKLKKYSTFKKVLCIRAVWCVSGLWTHACVICHIVEVKTKRQIRDSLKKTFHTAKNYLWGTKNLLREKISFERITDLAFCFDLNNTKYTTLCCSRIMYVLSTVHRIYCTYCGRALRSERTRWRMMSFVRSI